MSLIPLSNKRTEIHLSMWMGDASLSIVAAFFLPFVFIKKEDGELSTFTALDLFSVIAAVVTSAVRWYRSWCPLKPSVCTWRLDRQLRSLGHWSSSCSDDYGHLLPTPHYPQTAASRSHSERLSASRSSRFRRFWGHATWEGCYGHLSIDSRNS
jgi:hypothetical protein